MAEVENPKIIKADLSNTYHNDSIVALLDLYAKDPSGGSEGLTDYAKSNLIPALRDRRHIHAFLALVNGNAVGLLICIEGFSTFLCKPLLNIHDIVVSPECRGKGLSTMLLEACERLALEKNCCKLTLEVLERNEVAKAAYHKFGFKGYELDPGMGQALFWEKKLSNSR